jgi:hypothetical protein
MQLKRQIEEFSASLPGPFTFTYENLQIHAAEKIVSPFSFHLDLGSRQCAPK